VAPPAAAPGARPRHPAVDDTVRDDDLLARVAVEKDFLEGHFVPRPKSLKSLIWLKALFMDREAILAGCPIEEQTKFNLTGIKKFETSIRVPLRGLCSSVVPCASTTQASPWKRRLSGCS
jgi:hypothetical protein